MKFLKRHSAYFVGAGFSYIGAIGVNVSPDDIGRTMWALVGGTIIWPFFVVPQIILQWLTNKFIGQRFENSNTKRMLVLNLPIVFVVACLLAHHFVNLTPRSNFERLVGKPIPKSVQNLQQSGFLAMDSIFWVLYFKISPTDEERLVSDQHFTLASDTGENNHFVLNELIRTHSRLGVEITTNWQAYFLGKEKHLFFNTNDSEAVFVLDVH